MTRPQDGPDGPENVAGPGRMNAGPPRIAASGLPPGWSASLPFVLATLVPVPLLLAGALAGGLWVWLAALVPTLGVGLLDLLGRRVRAARPEAAGSDFPAGTGLSVALGLLHLPVLVLGVAAVGGLTGLAPAERAAMFLGVGVWLGQVSAANAHELIHRPQAALFRLGQMVYATLLFGHHVSAHRLVHHLHVATPADPNTARRGEGVYRFFWRSFAGSWRAGLAAERRRIAMRQGARADRAAGIGHQVRNTVGEDPRARAAARATSRNRQPPEPGAGPGMRAGSEAAEVPFLATPHAGYLAVAGLVVVLAAVAGLIAAGLPGALRTGGAALALGLYAASQVLVSDYVQHYGLRRARQEDGRHEPFGPAHAWNAPHPVSSAMMLHAPRHSDHHLHPLRPWPALRLPAEDVAPRLPASLPAMGVLALLPPLWRRVMDPRLAALAAARAPALPSGDAAEG